MKRISLAMDANGDVKGRKPLRPWWLVVQNLAALLQDTSADRLFGRSAIPSQTLGYRLVIMPRK